MQSKYPNVRVALVGEDENAFAIVERVQRALREAGVPAHQSLHPGSLLERLLPLVGNRFADGRDDMSEVAHDPGDRTPLRRRRRHHPGAPAPPGKALS